MNNISNPLVSVIVPIYNVEPYLERCMQSIIKQTYYNLEIILVDDGSPDNCPNICDKYEKNDNRIIVIHKENQGLAMARNSGLAIAKGEWLCFIDSDDYIEEHFVEYLLYAAKDNNALVAQCKYVKCIDEPILQVDSSYSIKVCDVDAFTREGFCTQGFSIWSCCINLYHKSIFETIRFAPLKHTEDVPTVQKCIQKAMGKPFVLIDAVMYCWFQRSGSIMNQKASLNLLDQSKAYELAMESWKDCGYENIGDLFFSNYYEVLIDGYCDLRRDIPTEQQKYEYLVDKIKNNFQHAVKEVHKYILFPIKCFKLFEYLEGKSVVMYGYGENGRRIYPWLKYYNIHVSEIWDSGAKEKQCIDDAILCRMHGGLSSNTVILQTVEAVHAFLEIKNALHKFEYHNIIEYKTIETAIRYRKFKDFLPFLLEEV